MVVKIKLGNLRIVNSFKSKLWDSVKVGGKDVK
jgi:hypothetical protein